MERNISATILCSRMKLLFLDRVLSGLHPPGLTMQPKRYNIENKGVQGSNFLPSIGSWFSSMGDLTSDSLKDSGVVWDNLVVAVV